MKPMLSLQMKTTAWVKGITVAKLLLDIIAFIKNIL
jgi:hypothetical protein